MLLPPLLVGAQACRRRTPDKPVQQFEFNPENQPWHIAMEVGIIAAQNGKYDRAISEFKRAISQKPDYAPSYAYLGLVYAKVGDPDRARVFLERTLRLDSRNEIALENLGVLLAEKKEYRRAEKCLQKAIQVNSENINARFNLAQLYKLQGESNKAIEEFLKLISQEPEISAFHYNLGVLYQMKGFAEQALEEYAKTVELDSAMYYEAYYQIAALHHAAKQYDIAEFNYLEVLKIDDQHLQSYVGLGDLYFDQGNYQQAQSHYTKALALSPENRYCLNALARLSQVLNQ